MTIIYHDTCPDREDHATPQFKPLSEIWKDSKVSENELVCEACGTNIHLIQSPM